MPAIAERRGFAFRIAVALVGSVAASACDVSYEPPVVRIIDDGGTASDDGAPPDVSTGGDDLSLEGNPGADESLAGDEPDIRTVVPDVGNAETIVDGDAEADVPVADGRDTGPLTRPDACAALDEADSQSPMSWTVGSDPTCSALPNVQCPDPNNPVPLTYSIRADGFCPSSDFRSCTPSTMTLWFGSTPNAQLMYQVVPAFKEADVHDVQPGQVALRIQVAGTTQQTWWAQSGAVQVRSDNGKYPMRFVNVMAAEESNQGSTTTVAGQLTCP
jgi:hypothetical protein